MNQENINYRFAELNDIAHLVAINVDGDEEYREKNERMFKDLIPEQKVMVAEMGGEIAALLYWRDNFLGRFNQWYLKQITVKKDYRGQGIGTAFLKHFLEYAKRQRVEKVFGDVHNDNFSSLKMNLEAGGLISGMIEGVGDTDEKDERVLFRFELKNL